jgi:Tfp pilus assembly protein PilO
MKATDRTVLIALPVVALIAAFWFLVLSPKREEVSTLDQEVSRLEGEVSQLEQEAALGQEAREGFPGDYKRVVQLGKAVPEDDDTSSLFAQLSGISARAGVDFRSLELVEGGGGEAAAPATAPEAAPEPPAETEGAEPTPASAPAAATETSAATLPIGATVGPAGLPVMPYKLELQGDFSRIADFIHGLDSTVSTYGRNVSVDGRLMTVDGFALSRDPEKDFPSLLATFAVTTYVTPEVQGLTGGATPAGPAPVSGTPAPVSSEGVAP